MCEECWAKLGNPDVRTPNTFKTVKAIRKLYCMPECGAGGPLHILTDDWNVRDHDIDFCTQSLEEDRNEFSQEVNNISNEILDLIRPMTVEERYTVLAIESGFITEGINREDIECEDEKEQEFELIARMVELGFMKFNVFEGDEPNSVKITFERTSLEERRKIIGLSETPEHPMVNLNGLNKNNLKNIDFGELFFNAIENKQPGYNVLWNGGDKK